MTRPSTRYDNRPDQALPDDLPDELIQLDRSLFAQEMADWPEQIRKLLIERHVSTQWLRAGFQEANNVDQLCDEMRHAAPMPDVRLIVLTSMGIDSFKRAVSQGTSESLLREEIEGKRRLYTTLAESVPRGEIRLIDDAGHVTVHLRRPSPPGDPGPTRHVITEGQLNALQLLDPTGAQNRIICMKARRPPTHQPVARIRRSASRRVLWAPPPSSLYVAGIACCPARNLCGRRDRPGAGSVSRLCSRRRCTAPGR